MEPADALDRLRQMSKLIETFKAQYAAYARKYALPHFSQWYLAASSLQ